MSSTISQTQGKRKKSQINATMVLTNTSSVHEENNSSASFSMHQKGNLSSLLTSSGNSNLDINSINNSNNTITNEFKMPVYRLVSPRTRRKITLLPSPNKDEIKQIDLLEKQALAQPVTLAARRGLYHALQSTQERQETCGDDTEEDTAALLSDMHQELQKMMETRTLRQQEKNAASGGRLSSPPTAHLRQPSSAYLEFSEEETKELQVETPRANWQELEVYNAGHSDRLSGRIANLHTNFLRTKKVQKQELNLIMEEFHAFKKREEMKKPSTHTRLTRMVIRLQKLHLHVACRPALQHWQVWSQNIQAYRRQRAALIIQARMLQKYARDTAKMMKKMAKLQEHRARKRTEERLARISKAALTIQLSWRGFCARNVLKQLKERQAAAKMIQMNWRVVHDYRKVRLFRLISTKRDKAAIKIQKVWRGSRGRVKYRLRKKIKRVAQMQSKLQKKELTRLDQFHKTGAAVTVQRFWRHVSGAKEEHSLLRIIQQSKAIVIQKAYRRHRARVHIRFIRTQYKHEKGRQTQVVILIQCQVRKYLARCRYDHMKYQLEKAALVRRIEKEAVFAARFAKVAGPNSCITIDTWKRREVLQRIADFMDPRYEGISRKASIHIQRVYRGHRARRRVKLYREMGRFRAYKREHKKKMKAIVDVQRVYRGRCGRRIARHARQTTVVTILQRLWRGYVARKHCHHLRHQNAAATILQKYTRGHFVRKRKTPLVIKYRLQTRKAKMIQGFFRGCLSRIHGRAKLERERRSAEARSAAHYFITLRLRMIGHKLLLESFACNFDYKISYGRRKKGSHKKLREFRGELQAMFTHFAQFEGENKLENTGFVQLLRQSPGILGKDFNETDCDLLFTRLKMPNTKHINWDAFGTALETISASIYTDIKRYYYRRGREARLLTLICENFFKGAWSEPYRQQLEEHVNCYVNVMCAPVQALIRGWLARIDYSRRLEGLIDQRRHQRHNSAAVVVQCFYRRAAARIKAVSLARTAYVKYIDPTTQLPYWYQSRTKKTSWIKPKIFGMYDVKRAKRLPDKASDFVVLCVNCDAALAHMSCGDCEEAFCQPCFDSVHMKGHKKEHVGESIKMCPECNYQMATKICKQCTFKVGKSIHYCDVCFWNIHKDEESQQHRIEDIVMTCVECERLAARWRCLDCRDLYCTGCFSKVHARGKKVQHRYEALRYYTRKMHLAYELQVEMEARKEEMTKHMMTLHQFYEKRKQHAAVKIQKTWRSVLGRRTGKKFLKIERRKLRVYYRLRKADDLIRVQHWYQLEDYFGLAPALRSDTMEEKVLKHFPKPARKVVTSRVVDNVEFLPMQVTDKKKVPKRGFNVGTEKELVEQGFYGGVRLPGVFTIKEAERMIMTTVDMRGFMNHKSRIRIKNLCFSVDPRKGIEEQKFYLNRLWRQDSLEKVIMYKMPDLNQVEAIAHSYWWEFVSSRPVQSLITQTVRLEQQIAKGFELAVSWAKKKGQMRLAEHFKAGIERHLRRAKRTKYLLNEFQDKYTVDGATQAQEDAAEALAELEAKEEAKRKSLENKYIKEEESEWTDEGRDPRSGKRRWKNRKTGEIVFDNPLLKMNANSDELTVAQKRMLDDKKKREMKKRNEEKIKKLLGK